MLKSPPIFSVNSHHDRPHLSYSIQPRRGLRLQNFPQGLDIILQGSGIIKPRSALVGGNASRDDAAVYGLTTNVRWCPPPIFYAHSGRPLRFWPHCCHQRHQRCSRHGWHALLAIAILAGSVNKLPPEVAKEVIRGGRAGHATPQALP